MVNPEDQVQPHLIPPLDPALLTLTEKETDFLRHAISTDDTEIRKRVLDVQKISYEKYPYPCIRFFHFVNLMMSLNAVYPDVVAAGKTGQTLFLDIGCFMGTDVRKLAYDGYPPSRILGCDLRPEYIECGHTLFQDKDTCPIRFFASDIFDLSDTTTTTQLQGALPDPILDVSAVSDLSQLRGAVTHIYTGALFHLFDEETQYALALRLVALLQRTPGATIFGRHQGLDKEGYLDDPLGRKRYAHSDVSWPLLWKKVFAETDGEAFAERIVVQTKLPGAFSRLIGRQHFMLYWSVQIV